MAKLFTRTDLERCARLAVTHVTDGTEAELAIAEAVSDIVCEAEPVYTRFQVLDTARIAASLVVAYPGMGAARAAETAADDVLGTL